MIHSNNISEILALFEYFRNMYPCHRRFLCSVLIAIETVFLYILGMIYYIDFKYSSIKYSSMNQQKKHHLGTASLKSPTFQNLKGTLMQI